DENDHNEPILLPQSTHTLLSTEPVFSFPFIFAVIIAIMSAMCLILALMNNATHGLSGNRLSIPVNVGPAVRGAQYVTLLMEEEIPTALYLLRNITSESLMQKFSNMKYGMFVMSSLLRLVLGYTFLINVMLVVIQAESVLVATKQKYFISEFERKSFVRFQKTNLFLKAMYLFNLFISLGGVLYVTILQRSGHFQCSKITVKFGDDVWEKAVVKQVDGSLKQMVLVYSFFNGVYVASSNLTSGGRPVYVEQRWCRLKSNTAKRSKHGYSHTKISRNRIHPMIQAVLRGFNLLEVSGYWSVWKGVIEYSEFSAVCNECFDDTGMYFAGHFAAFGRFRAKCNLNGACTNRKCICDPKSQHIGTHCEHQLPCRKLHGYNNDTWSLYELEGNKGDFFSVHDRPVYIYSSGLGNLVDEADQVGLVYTGSRWFGALYEGLKSVPLEFWVEYSTDFHSFWDKIYDNNTVTLSDPTTDLSPIGVDFYIIRNRGEQYGPYGLLEPLRLPSGSGHFRCGDVINNTEKLPQFMSSERMLRFQNSKW
ncbi:hypothetical protein ACHAXS_001558, partial [Conticribra weissflogii]